MGSRPSGDPKIRAKDIFSAIDVDQDGTLTCEEFVKGEKFSLELASSPPYDFSYVFPPDVITNSLLKLICSLNIFPYPS